MSDNLRSFAHMGMQVADDCRVTCSTYTDHRPILSIRAGSVTVDFSTRGAAVNDDAVKFARDLLGQVQKFAAETERLHAEQAAVVALRRADKAA